MPQRRERVEQPQQPGGFRADLMALIREGVGSEQKAKRLRSLTRMITWPAFSLGAFVAVLFFATICVVIFMIVHAGAMGTVAEAAAGVLGTGSVGRTASRILRGRHESTPNRPNPPTNSEITPPDDAAQPPSGQGAIR